MKISTTRIAPVFYLMRALYYPPTVSEFKFDDNISQYISIAPVFPSLSFMRTLCRYGSRPRVNNKIDNYRIISKNRFQSLQKFSVLINFNHTSLIVHINFQFTNILVLLLVKLETQLKISIIIKVITRKQMVQA